MARIEDLLKKIDDPALREELAREVAVLKEHVDFGLVFAWSHRFARALHLARPARPLPVRVGLRFFPVGRSHPDGALRAGKE